MASSSLSCGSLSPDFGVMECASGDDHKWRRKCEELKEDKEAMALMRLLVAQEDDLQDKLAKRSKVKLSQGIIGLFTHLCAYDEMIAEIKNSTLPCKSCDALCAENEKLKNETNVSRKHVEFFRRACDNLDGENDELRSSLACLKSENDSLKSNASMPCTSCVALDDDLVKARSKIALLESNASLPCISCESLLAEINELKLTHITCVDELEHARAKICEMKSMPCSKCSLLIVDDACHTSCDDDNALVDVNDVACSCDFICTTCIDLESEVLALKKMRDDMSAKLVEHDERSANLEKEIENVRNIPCGTCEHLKFENEVLLTRYKSLCAKGLDSRVSCHSDVDAFKIASSQPELTSSFERESLDDGTCASALDSSSIATPKLGGVSGVAQDDSNGKGASHIFGTHAPKPKFQCTFCKKDGHTIEFCFRHVKHKRHERAKVFKKPRSLSHGTCVSDVGTESSDGVNASCSKSQGTSQL